MSDFETNPIGTKRLLIEAVQELTRLRNEDGATEDAEWRHVNRIEQESKKLFPEFDWNGDET